MLLPPERARELVHLNALAPVLLTRAVLPGMIERRRGAVVNVASLLAFSGAAQEAHLPKRAVCASTKSFLVTFTETLAPEMTGTGIKVQVVCPGVVRTEFHERQGMDLSHVPSMQPEPLVTASLADLARGIVVCIPAMPVESAKAAFDAAAGALLRVQGALIPSATKGLRCGKSGSPDGMSMRPENCWRSRFDHNRRMHAPASPLQLP